MDDIWDLVTALGQHAPLLITVCVTFMSGLVLNYFGAKYFADFSNSALFATGAILAATLASELLRKGGPASTWTETALLPFGAWAAGALLAYLDSKLHLLTILNFLVAAIICGVLMLGLWVGLLGDAIESLSPEETLVVLGVSLVVMVIGGLIIVKIQFSKPMLILACVMSGSVLIGNGFSNLAALLGNGTSKVSHEMIELQTLCLEFPSLCRGLASSAGMTPQQLFPWATPAFLVILITGIIMQSVVLLRQRKKERLPRAVSTG